MISKTLRIALTIVLASFALDSAARAATCSNASVSGIYGSLGEGTNPAGQPEANLFQFNLDPSTGQFIGTDETGTSVTGTYEVASDCTVTGTTTKGTSTHPFSAVVTSTGMQSVSGNPGATNGGFWVAQGSPACTNAGVEGSFGLAARGTFLAGAPFTGPVILVGELALRVSASGEGVISGHAAGSEDGTILTFAEEPITGSYTIGTDCKGTVSVTLRGQPEMNFSLVVVNGGKEMLAIETDADTVVTGTLVKSNETTNAGGLARPATVSNDREPRAVKAPNQPLRINSAQTNISPARL